MSNAPARRPPQIKPTNMVKAAIKAAKDAGIKVVIEPDGVVTIRPVGERKKRTCGLTAVRYEARAPLEKEKTS